MTRHLATSTALLLASGSAFAHDRLALDGAFHRALHALGSERLVILGGVVLALGVGYAVRRAARQAAARRARGEG